MTTNPWDDPELKTGEGFYELKEVGDSLAGIILSITKHTWPDGKVCPQLLLKDDTTGEEKTLTAGQAQLKAKLIELRPGVGDHLSVKFAQKEQRGGGKTLHHFDVVVNDHGQPQAAAPAAAPASTVADPQAALAAAGNLGLTPEQLAALAQLQPQTQG